jgi:Tfp pilus assembly protein PilV
MKKPLFQSRSWRQKQAGFGLVEIFISVAVVVIILTTVAGGLAFSLKTSSELKFRGLALAKAQALMEAVRRERAISGWDNFFIITGGSPGVYIYCYNNEADLLHASFNWNYGACTETVTWDGNDYIRELEADTTIPGQANLTATVYWQGRTKKIELKQVLNNWQ